MKKTANILPIAAALLLGAALLSGAWFADDALRLWRIGLDWTRFGSPDFNPGHRILEMEQPLWAAMLAAAIDLRIPPAAASIALEYFFFTGGILLLWRCHKRSSAFYPPSNSLARAAGKIALLAGLLAASNAFREYMCSGLEFPLCLLTVSALALLALRFEKGEAGAAATVGLAALAESVLALSRIDLAIALIPLAILPAWRLRASLGRLWPAAALGWIPIAAWVAYAEPHFGGAFSHRPSLFLAASLARPVILRHGILYLLSGAIEQPLTYFLLVYAGAAAAYSAFKVRRITPSALLFLAVLVDLAIVVWEGGDTVSGRMLCPAALLAAAAVASAPALPLRACAFLACYGAVFFNFGKVSLMRGGSSRVPRTTELFREWGIVDDFQQEKARGPAGDAALKSVRLANWHEGHPGTIISASPGWDGIAAGPAATVLESDGLGPPRPELPGILKSEIQFVPQNSETVEPVLAFGSPRNGMLLAAEHLGGGAVRFQLWMPGAVPLFSRAFQAGTSSAHTLEVAYGPAVAGGPAQFQFKLMLDGSLLKDLSIDSRHFSFSEVVPGWNVQGKPDCSERFSGVIGPLVPGTQGDFVGRKPPNAGEADHIIEMRVRFSEVTNSAEPIVVTGKERLGDIVYVRRLGPGRILFGQEHWGQSPELGAPVDIDDHSDHILKVALGPLFAASDGMVRPGLARVTMDGRDVFSAGQVLYPFSPGEVCVLDNPLAGSFSGRDFLGEVRSVAMVPIAPQIAVASKVLSENAGPVTLSLRFDGIATGRGLGLFEKGVSGAADVVYVILSDRSHARFYFDHWGIGGVTGSEVEFNPAAVHVLRIEMGSLAAAGDAGGAFRDRLTLDGRVVLEGSSPSAAKAGPIHIAANAVHSSNVAEPFDGTVLSVERGAAKADLRY